MTSKLITKKSRTDRFRATYGHGCAYCGRQREKLTRDHVLPKYRGGTGDDGNIVPACFSCNTDKADHLLHHGAAIRWMARRPLSIHPNVVRQHLMEYAHERWVIESTREAPPEQWLALIPTTREQESAQ